MPKTDPTKLSLKQKMFCMEYVKEYNAVKSYLKVCKNKNIEDVPTQINGKPNKEYFSAAKNAGRWIQMPLIQAEIKQLFDNLAVTAGISQLKVLLEFKKLGFSNIADLHDGSWMKKKDFDKLSDEQKACIKSFKIQSSKKKITDPKDGKKKIEVTIEWVEIELFDKQKALENINKMLGYNEPEKTEVKAEITELTDLSHLTFQELMELKKKSPKKKDGNSGSD